MKPADLARAESGAIMLFGVFFCVLGVSLVYYLWGIAEVIGYREQVQDAADLGAFAAAVVHANGMNLLALLNMVMAGLLAVLVSLRLVQVLTWVATGAIFAVGWWTGGALYSAIPPIQQSCQWATQMAEQLKQPIHKAIKGLHTAGDALAVLTPTAAFARSVQISHAAYGPEVAAAAGIPSRIELPVEADVFDRLCEKAGEYAGELAMFPLGPVIPDAIEGAVANALSKLTRAGSNWFCGKKDAEPPSVSRSKERRVGLPQSGDRARCTREDGPVGGSNLSNQEIKEACAEATLYEMSSLPDRRGECRAGQPVCPAACPDPQVCPPTGNACHEQLGDVEDSLVRARAGRIVDDCGPLTWRYEEARRQCAPRSADGPEGLRGFGWLEKEVRREYTLHRGRWVRTGETTSVPPHVVTTDEDTRRHPCGRAGSVGIGYEFAGTVCESTARCEHGDRSRPCPRSVAMKPGARIYEHVTLVQEMVQCVHVQRVPKAERQRQVEALDVTPTGDDKEKLAPFKVVEDVWLGDGALQIRAIAWGQGPSGPSEAGVKLAAWGREVDQPLLVDLARKLEGFGIAQGEYYFHTDESPLDQSRRKGLLWSMNWRARLRPLRLMQGGMCQGIGKLGNSGRFNAAKRVCDKLENKLLDNKLLRRFGLAQ